MSQTKNYDCKEVDQKFNAIKDVLGENLVLEALYQWLDTDTMGEALTDICKSYDLDIMED